MTAVWITFAAGWLATVLFVTALCRVAARGDALVSGI